MQIHPLGQLGWIVCKQIFFSIIKRLTFLYSNYLVKSYRQNFHTILLITKHALLKEFTNLKFAITVLVLLKSSGKSVIRPSSVKERMLAYW